MSEPNNQRASDGAEHTRQNTAVVLREKRDLSGPLTDDEARRRMSRRSRRTFLIGAAAAALGGLGFWWLRQPQNTWIFDRVLRFNEKLSQKFFNARQLAPEFSRVLAQEPRVNGMEGLSNGFNLETWRLQVTGLADPKRFQQFGNNLVYEATDDQETAKKFPATPAEGLLLTLADIKGLPRVEMTTQLKCIEGWSVIVNWAGARFSDFTAKFNPSAANSPAHYVSLVTPDRGYYVGWDVPSILHPQTLLCYEMNGAPLTLPHGGPLRLVTTTKYGIKQIKRIGRINFTAERPPDYWAERGYDWYSGL